MCLKHASNIVCFVVVFFIPLKEAYFTRENLGSTKQEQKRRKKDRKKRHELTTLQDMADLKNVKFDQIT